MPTGAGIKFVQGRLAVTGLGVIQASLCALSLAAAVIILPVEYQIYRHLRQHHGKALDQMRIHSPSFLWREDRDAQSTAFADFFSSRKHVTLNDPRLNALLRLKSLIWRTCGVSFALLLSTFLVFRADPAHVWDFLRDLSHY
jgi:hypothetical protein